MLQVFYLREILAFYCIVLRKLDTSSSRPSEILSLTNAFKDYTQSEQNVDIHHTYV